MTVASATNRNDYVGNGSADTFSYSFKIFDQSHLLVTVKETATGEETTLTLTTQYTVTGVGETSGGNVVLVDDGSDWLDAGGDLDTGWELTIRRVVPLTQLTDIRNQGSFFPEAHEDQFDLLVMIDQQQQNELDRTPKFSETSDQTDIVIPEPEADKAWFWNALGTAIEYRTISYTSGTYPGTFTAGVDASKAASPSTNDVYIATDTKILYVCFSSGTWTVISTLSGTDASKAASPKVGQVYLATDTGKVYFCFVAGTWTTALTLSNTLTMSGAAINTAKGSDIASATTTDIGAATGNFVDITGTTTITGLGTVQAGTLRAVRFSGALTLTHNATSLILPGGANITTASGDTALFVSLGSGNWRCLFYSKASGYPIVSTGGGVLSSYKNLSVTRGSATQVTATADELILENTSNNKVTIRSVNVTAAITASGANGLDMGAEGSSRWYYLWVIRKSSDGTVASLLSESSSSPTMPSGYDQKALVSAVYNDGSSNFIDFKQTGKRYSYVSWRTLTSGNIGTGAWVSVTMTNFVPSALSTHCYGSVNDGGSAGACANDSTVAIGTTGAPNKYCPPSGRDTHWDFSILTANTLYAIGDNANFFFRIHGFDINKLG